LNWRAGVALSILAFVGGGLAISWLSSSGLTPWGAESPVAPARPEPTDAPEAPSPPVNPMLTTGVTPQILQPVADSARTEAMLVAMAARRAIGAGVPLGDLNPRLDAAFGTTQAQALARIRAVEKDGITPISLATDFDTIAASLTEDRVLTWERMQREVWSLFVLRKSDSAKPSHDAQLQRIRDLVLTGNIDSAIQLVLAMPGAAKAQDWLVKARRLRDAQTALDSLEKFALSMPMIAPQAVPLTPMPPLPVQGSGTDAVIGPPQP
jgi:hypothetical protein